MILKAALEPPMNADESVPCGRRLFHIVGDEYELLHRFYFSASIGVYRRLIDFSRINDTRAETVDS